MASPDPTPHHRDPSACQPRPVVVMKSSSCLRATADACLTVRHRGRSDSRGSSRCGRAPTRRIAVANAVPAWTRTRNWTVALLAFKIHFGDRIRDAMLTPTIGQPSTLGLGLSNPKPPAQISGRPRVVRQHRVDVDVAGAEVPSLMHRFWSVHRRRG
jgi:hypothetical protein